MYILNYQFFIACIVFEHLVQLFWTPENIMKQEEEEDGEIGPDILLKDVIRVLKYTYLYPQLYTSL